MSDVKFYEYERHFVTKDGVAKKWIQKTKDHSKKKRLPKEMIDDLHAKIDSIIAEHPDIKMRATDIHEIISRTTQECTLWRVRNHLGKIGYYKSKNSEDE
jgi:hypothetical protein